VLSRLYRRLLPEGLQAAFDAGDVAFFNDLAFLRESDAFARLLAQALGSNGSSTPKPPFGGPNQVLAYLESCTHRAAIANGRLTAIENGQAMRDRGSFAPRTMGGDTRSRRVEAHADYLLRLHRLEPDLTLAEICARLERARGEKVSPSMIWRFFERHDITFKTYGPPRLQAIFRERE
jgi:hypothetical protein